MHRFKKWRDALLAAPSAESIVQVIRDYLGALPSEVVQALPESCQEVLSIESGVDIQVAAVTLLQCELSYAGPQEVGDVLHEMAHTLAVASVRITSLGNGTLTQPRPDPNKAV